MSEPKPIYDATITDYWQIVAEQERKKAADNLRLAAERASEIAELKQELQKTKTEIERLKSIIRKTENLIQEWNRKTIRICCDSEPGEEHEIDCPLYKWEGGE